MIDFDIAKTWHRMYTEKLQLVAAGANDEAFTLERVCNDSACTLGKWLYGEGKCLDGVPAYNQLLRVHQGFHDIACRYLNIALGDGDALKREEVEADLASLSASVVAAIERLQVDVAAGQRSGAAAPPLAQAIPEIAWDEALTVGLPAIDEHHKALVRITSNLMRDPDASLHSEYAVDNLTDLGKILILHFSIEEEYMQQLDMPQDEFEAHRKRHQEILDQWARINVASYSSRNLKVKDIAEQVRTWAVDHVVAYDLNMRKYLPAGGVQ